MRDQANRNPHLHLAQDLKSFFAEECLNIASKQGLGIPEYLGQYLGEMLARLSGSDAYLVKSTDPHAVTHRKEFPSIVKMWLEGQTQDPTQQLYQMQQVGDLALFTSSFFPERIERTIDMDFYMAVGGQAYARAGQIRETIAHERALNVYFELASKFPELKELLAELNDKKFLSTEADRLRLYEKWLHTRSPRIRRMLAEVGIIAGGGPSSEGSDGT